jgi:hypothetical protein
LLSFSICSLTAVARLSWLMVRSYISMRQVNIQKAGRNQTLVRCLSPLENEVILAPADRKHER